MDSPLNFIGIIPARFASTRFPGKPLAKIKGRPMIQLVYEQACKSLTTAYVATDDQRIFDAVKNFGGRVVMTSTNHKSGTDRCTEAVIAAESELHKKFDVVLNIQGDEPFIAPQQLDLIISCFLNHDTQIATLVKEINSYQVLFDPNRPKVVLNARNQAIFFSRSAIPYIRGKEANTWLDHTTFYSHIGLYGFRRDILPQITSLPQSKLELAESLEQLRWIENGYTMDVRITAFESFGIDTPEDLKNAEKMLK